MVQMLPLIRRPVDSTLANSAAVRRRCDRGGFDTVLRREALATLRSATSDDAATADRCHACAESVRTATAKAFRLVRVLHGLGKVAKRRASLLVRLFSRQVLTVFRRYKKTAVRERLWIKWSCLDRLACHFLMVRALGSRALE